MKGVNIKQMSVDELLALRDQINALLNDRVDQERRDLEGRLKRLQRFKPEASTRGKKTGSSSGEKRAPAKKTKQRKKVAAKYRNPENAEQTWTGRGLKPRWMKGAIEAGKSIEDFRI